jgi:HPt (histidine-containing phosphotransfer) domain-containing protein
VREPPLREEVLAGITGGDASFERELLAHFLASTDGDAARLDAAISERASERVGAIAHRVQGRCKTLGAATLASAGERLEHAASRGSWSDIAEAHARVREELAALRRAIARRLP